MLRVQGRRSHSRAAFTLVELLVVIAIIAVLIGLLLPAVQKVREAANRMHCDNHLKQIGLGLHNYHDTHGVLPPGYLSGVDSTGNDTGPGWGWAALMLPYIEQQALFNQINLKLPIEDPAHAAVRVMPLITYLCPSDSPPRTFASARRSATGQILAPVCDLATSNYAGVFGIGEPGVDGEGVFFRNSQLKITDITDGTSNTLMIGERAYLYGETTWVGAVTGASMVAPPGSPMPPQVLNSSNNILGHAGEAVDGPASPKEPNHFSSRHTGVVNFAFADGSVRALSNKATYQVYKALATRAGGETIPGDY